VAAEKLIRVSAQTKRALDKLREHPRETYDDVIRRLLKGGKAGG